MDLIGNSSEVLEVVGYLKWISGILCVVAILISLFKMVTEEDGSQYKVKIKHALVALVLILTVTGFVNLIPSYFSTADIGIGAVPAEAGNIIQIGGSTSLSVKDKDGRELLMIDGIKCVVYKEDQELWYHVKNESLDVDNIYVGGHNFWVMGSLKLTSNTQTVTGWRKAEGITVDNIKQYSKSQGSGSGRTKDTYAVRVHLSGNIENAEKLYSNYDDNLYEFKLTGAEQAANWSGNVGDIVWYTDSNGNATFTNLVNGKYESAFKTD